MPSQEIEGFIAHFQRAINQRIHEIFETVVALGKALTTADGRFQL